MYLADRALAAIHIPSSFILNSAKNTKVADVYGSPGQLISVLLPQVYLASGLLLFVLLVGGGLRIISSAGDPKGVESGQKAIVSAAIGFGLIFISYWVIQIIEVVTGVSIFNSTL